MARARVHGRHESVRERQRRRRRWILLAATALALVLVGALNGLILPVTLGAMLLAARNKKIVGDYEHPTWLMVFGILAAAVAAYAGAVSLQGMAALWK